MTVTLSHGIRLLSGNLFDYSDPDAGIVTIEDIANALSNICRFAGHIPYFYSVAQHAYNVSMIVPPEYALAGLLHDTSEAFTNDIPTPLKHAVPMFKDLERKIEASMGRRFGFDYPLHTSVKYADSQMLGLEKIHIKGDHSHWDVLDGIDFECERENVVLESWTPGYAGYMFLKRYQELTA